MLAPGFDKMGVILTSEDNEFMHGSFGLYTDDNDFACYDSISLFAE